MQRRKEGNRGNDRTKSRILACSLRLCVFALKFDVAAGVVSKPVDDSVNAVFCHLPLLAKQMHHVAQVRSVHHKVLDHNAGAYYCLTGRSPVDGGRLIVGDEPTNFPPYGSVVAQRYPVAGMPAFVHLPDVMSNNNHDLPGQRGGFLSPDFDPLVAGDPSEANYRIPGLSLPKDMPPERLQSLRELLARLEEQNGRRYAQAWDTHRDHFPLLKRSLLPSFLGPLGRLGRARPVARDTGCGHGRVWPNPQAGPDYQWSWRGRWRPVAHARLMASSVSDPESDRNGDRWNKRRRRAAER
jgi:hypothetical protein